MKTPDKGWWNEIRLILDGYMPEEYFISYYDYQEFRNYLGMCGKL